jgi:cellulose synthase operon protein C
MHSYFAEALFGQGDYMRAGYEYSQAATVGHIGGQTPDSTVFARAMRAGQNAIVAYDSALVRNKNDRATQDSMFAAADRFVESFPNSDIAKKALISKGRRASETQRWDVMEQAFRTYAQKYPNDPYTPTAQRLIGDALFRGGQYAQAQQQWENAQGIAMASGRRALVDSIVRVREAAAATFADTLIKQGNYSRAAEEVYVAFADKNPTSPKAPESLRDAIETYMIVVDSAKAKGQSDDAVKQARDRAIELTNRIVTQYPTYKYRTQYQTLNARLLADAGRTDEAVAAQRKLIADLGKGTAQADAMIRLATILDDSLKQKSEAAAAYIAFAQAYPADKRAPDALYNAAITYAEGGDRAAAARTYADFARRYPRTARADTARARQVVLLTEAGDTASANAAFSAMCASGSAPADVRRECTARATRRTAQAEFQRGVTLFNAYQPVALVIPNIQQLTAAGVTRASARKQSLLKGVTTQFTKVIQYGVPEYLAGATYHIGLAQAEYGNFLTNVQLPASLTDEQRAAAQQGAARQAQQYYQAAQQTWQALIEKADQDSALKNDPGAQPWLAKAREAMASLPAAPAAAQPAAPPAADTTRRPPEEMTTAQHMTYRSLSALVFVGMHVQSPRALKPRRVTESTT